MSESIIAVVIDFIIPQNIQDFPKKNSINLKKKSELLSAVLLAINDNKDCESALENP